MGLSDYQPTIGLEVHCQLKAASKLFCSCSTAFGAPPNHHACPVCLGLPGALPVLNRTAVDFAIKMALATQSSIRRVSVFSRKQYFYPDLPKGYQISQYDQPYCQEGFITLASGKKVGLTRIHLEEDAGKNVHAGKSSYIDLNRAGTPLIEIVSKPEIASAEEASEYLKQLRSIARYLEISDGNLEEGSFRCDANVSIRKMGDSALGTRTEIKNLNSFKNVERAINYEILRQADLLDSGKKVLQATMHFDAPSGKTSIMRLKEEAEDYRYFPEPDLLPLVITSERINQVRPQMAELPSDRTKRFEGQFQLSATDAAALTSERELADYYESVVQYASKVSPKLVANWVLTELLHVVNAQQGSMISPPLTSRRFAELLDFIGSGAISGKIAKSVFEEMIREGKDAESIIDGKGLAQISDQGEIIKVIREILAEHQEKVVEYQSGKTKIFAFFVGQIMKKSGGKLNPALVNDLLQKALQKSG